MGCPPMLAASWSQKSEDCSPSETHGYDPPTRCFISPALPRRLGEASAVLRCPHRKPPAKCFSTVATAQSRVRRSQGERVWDSLKRVRGSKERVRGLFDVQGFETLDPLRITRDSHAQTSQRYVHTTTHAEATWPLKKKLTLCSPYRPPTSEVRDVVTCSGTTSCVTPEAHLEACKCGRTRRIVQLGASL